MKLSIRTAEIFVPDGLPPDAALQRTTHMGIGAHQDDLEIMALDGILKCFQREDAWFCGVVVTDGSGSPRDDIYKHFTDEDMRVVRRKEQKKAAFIGEYSAQVLLDFPSAIVKNGVNRETVEDLMALFIACRPQVVYTHNLADKHDTHVAVALRVIEAIRELPRSDRPQQLFGCEVWRDLDWLPDDVKVSFDVTTHENLHAALLGVFDSQICGGKRYDLATMGRRRANATYFASHGVDVAEAMIYAMNLSPLISDPKLDITGFIKGFTDRFSAEIHDRLNRLG